MPNVTWNDVATMADLAALETSLRGEMSALRGEVKHDIARGTRVLVFGMVASHATVVGLVLAAARVA